ncbi:hypothetical protein PM082_018368 [Marasmius tenuissimus]|nr:hypothetical protein PM082_018368 [Marasmius tenuissimus]
MTNRRGILYSQASRLRSLNEINNGKWDPWNRTDGGVWCSSANIESTDGCEEVKAFGRAIYNRLEGIERQLKEKRQRSGECTVNSRARGTPVHVRMDIGIVLVRSPIEPMRTTAKYQLQGLQCGVCGLFQKENDSAGRVTKVVAESLLSRIV